MIRSMVDDLPPTSSRQRGLCLGALLLIEPVSVLPAAETTRHCTPLALRFQDGSS